MRPGDRLHFAWDALHGFRVRTALMLLAMAIGVASVVLLTGLGEAARRYVIGEFSSLGTDLLVVLPGRSETVGGPPPLLGLTPRDLTLEDALALLRQPAIERVAPIVIGSVPVSAAGRERESTVVGTTADFAPIRRVEIAAGRFLPGGDPRRSRPVCVLGRTLETELFGGASALGETLRLGDRRCRVIGVLGSTGRSLDVQLDELVLVPVTTAQALFDTPALFRVLVQARGRALLERAREAILGTVRARHDGEDDVTVITQDAMLATFDRILGTLTLAVGGIGAISLAVAGILIMNVMLVAVSQRTAEIGLLMALGAPPRQVLGLFLVEAGLLALGGALLGLAFGVAGTWLLGQVYPALDFRAPAWAPPVAVLVAVGLGLLFGALPARHAARLDPVTALARR
ncbi:MAG: ABC transporter permease [Gammaproteobacteria bacterium]|nr:ABC transporter permease [Gammaproteobacteria bacterium]